MTHESSNIEKLEYGGKEDHVQIQVAPPSLSTVLGNPAPAGMFAFAGSVLLMSLYNLGAGGVTVPNVLVGMLVFAGGITLVLVAMWEIARGNTMFATAFLTFSTFWLSYSAVLIPSFGVMEAFAATPEQIPKALGIYLFVWFVTITCLIPGVLGKSTLFTILLSTASIAILMLACGQYTSTKAVNIVGNSLLLVVTAIAYYIGVAALLASDPGSAFSLPLF